MLEELDKELICIYMVKHITLWHIKRAIVINVKVTVKKGLIDDWLIKILGIFPTSSKSDTEFSRGMPWFMWMVSSMGVSWSSRTDWS